MEGRRQFIKRALGFLAILSAMLNSVFPFLCTVYAKAQKFILPKDTKRESLISKDPKDLDASQMPITPLEEFDTMGSIKNEVDIRAWRLQISGLIKNPLSLNYDQILDLASIEKKVLMICPGFFANHGNWKGVSMKPLLEKIMAAESATQVVFSGHNDGLTKEETFPIEDIISNKVFLAYKVNGKDLPEKHGYPLRVVAEDYYGDDWVKYVYEMKLV